MEPPKNAPLYLVDAFAARRFTGNPAGVCLLAAPADPRWMQSLALELNQAETAFVHRSRAPKTGAVGSASFELRWFTPVCEVDLCGHATLASAHVLWERGDVAIDQAIRFQTRSGELTAARRGAQIELDFPAEPAVETAPPSGLLASLRLPPVAIVVFVGRNRMDWLVEIEQRAGSRDARTNEALLRSLQPDLPLLATIPARGVIVTTRAAPAPGGPDFLSRFFAPAAGVPEDPVTGSAHCALAPHWCARLGRDQLVGYQASPRGGSVGVTFAGARVLLRGSAVTAVRGEVDVGG